MCIRTPLRQSLIGIETSRSRKPMSLITPVWSSLLTSCRDDKFDAFMEPIVQSFETAGQFDIAFDTWLTTDKDNWSTRGFLMAGPQGKDGGAPDPQ